MSFQLHRQRPVSLQLLTPVRYLLIVWLALSAACTTLLPGGESVRLFILTPQQHSAETTTNLWSAVSVRAESSTRFDTDRLLMLDAAQELLPYRGARWAARIPELVAESWAASMEQSGISAISYDQPRKQSVRPALIIHIRDFQAQLVTDAQALCQVSVVLEFLPNVQEEAQYLTLSAERLVDVKDPAQVAAGFDRAHAEVIKQALRWLRDLGGPR